jgi:hypothetical protein
MEPEGSLPCLGELRKTETMCDISLQATFTAKRC